MCWSSISERQWIRETRRDARPWSEQLEREAASWPSQLADSTARCVVHLQHWLVFTAIELHSNEDEVIYKPPDPRLKLGLDTAGQAPGEHEMGEPWLVRREAE